jgi:hypothetical protein
MIALCFMSCGDSWTEYEFYVDNQTEFNVTIYISNKTQDSILCLPNTKTNILSDGDFRSKRGTLSCLPTKLSDWYTINIVVDNGQKNITKDFFNEDNWECSGTKDFSVAMFSNIYIEVESTFVITDEDVSAQ